MMVQLLYCVGLFLTFPVMMFPAVQILERSSCYKRFLPASLNAIKRHVFRFFVVAAATLMALYTPHFGLFINLIGAVSCSTLAFVVPALIYRATMGKKLTRWKRAQVWAIVAFGVGGGAYSAALTLIGFTEAGDEGGEGR